MEFRGSKRPQSSSKQAASAESKNVWLWPAACDCTKMRDWQGETESCWMLETGARSG